MLATENGRPEPARSRREDHAPQRIVIVAEPDFLVECLAEVLKRHFPDHEVVVEDQAGEALRQHPRIRLILFHRMDAADIARMLRDLDVHAPSAASGVLIEDSRALDPILTLLAGDRHIDGILPLDVRLDVFLAGVDLLVKGGEHFPSALLRRLKSAGAPSGPAGVRRLLTQYADFAQPGGRESHLTTREVEILDLLCRGTQNKIIAHRLNLSENTVKAHVRNIYKNLRVKNRTEAAGFHFDKPHPAAGPARPPAARS